MSDQVELFAEPEAEPESGFAVSFFVAGIPAPQGSKSAFRNASTGKVVMREMSPRLGSWRADTKAAAMLAMGPTAPLIVGAVELSLTFLFLRPKSHFLASGKLNPKAPRYHTQAPDLSKLIRGIEDALSGTVYVDDKQVVRHIPFKDWLPRPDDRPGCHVTVRALL